MVAKKDYRAELEKVDQEDWWSVLSWLEAIKQEAATREIVLLLCRLVGHKSPHVRLATMQILLLWVESAVVQEVGERVAESLAARFLYSEHTDIKILAAGILAFLPNDAAFPLIRLYEQAEQDHQIDKQRIEQFFQELPVRFLPAVLDLLATWPPEWKGNDLLYRGLWDMGEEAKDAIPVLLKHIQANPFGGYLVRLVGRICGADVAPLCEVLALDRPELNNDCIRALKEKGKAALPALPYVLRLLQQGEGEGERMKPYSEIVGLLLGIGAEAREAVLPLFQRLKAKKRPIVEEAQQRAFLFFARVGSDEAKEALREGLKNAVFRDHALKALVELRLSFQEEYEEWAAGLALLLERGDTQDWERASIAKVLEAWGERAVFALPAVLRMIGAAPDYLVVAYLRAIRAMGKEAAKQAVERVSALLLLQKNAAKDLLDFLAYALDGEEKVDPEVDPQESRTETFISEEVGDEANDEESAEAEREEDKGIILPFQSNQVRFEVRSMTVDLLLSRIKHNELVLQPEFQRGDVWSKVQKSRLIESLLLRIPLPSFYIDGSDVDRWQVIDGQQRLTAIRAFLLDDVKESLRLEGLEFFPSYEGFHREQMPRHVLRRLQETQVTLFVVEAKMERALMFNIFKRINTGGTPLSSQEIRHALYQGHATELLKELASSENFQRALGAAVNDKRMETRELVLRGMVLFVREPEKWFVFREEDRLNQTMEAVNQLSLEDLETLRSAMVRAYDTAFSLFGLDAFRKSPFDGKRSRSPLNKAIFEAWVANLAACEPSGLELLVENKENVVALWRELLQDERFLESISSWTSRMEHVKYRFYAVKELLEKALVSHKG